MCDAVSSPTASRLNRWRMSYGRILRPLSCSVLIAAAVYYCGSVDDGLLFWASNGILLTYLLLAPRRSWPVYLAAGLVGHFAATVFFDISLLHKIVFTLVDTCEPLLAALLLRRRSSELPDFTDFFYLVRFFTYAVVAAPLLCCALGATANRFLFHGSFQGVLLHWMTADCLGMCVSTPAFVAVFRARLRRFFSRRQSWPLLIATFAICTGIFFQTTVPTAFILYPLLILVLLQAGLGWASLAALWTATIGTWATAHGWGLVVRFASPQDMRFHGVLFQIFIVSIMVTLYSVSVVIETQRSTERRLQRIAHLHALLAENARETILLIDFEGTRTLISSQAHLIGGWNRDDILSVDPYELIHPDDRAQLAKVLKEQRSRKEGSLFECRIRRKDSGYAWIEVSLRTVRDPITRIPFSVLAIIREISERKYAEQQLEDAYHAVEALAVTDSLTGLSNRRRFDQALASEWRRALREKTPLSLLIADADFFKLYNDTYGHPSGDMCLRQIAEAVREEASRASDVTARIGGEEFAVLLPNTYAEGARFLARRICEAVRRRTIPHPQNPSGVVTISVGWSTAIPQPGQGSALLVDLADQALYEAKRSGRNRAYPDTAGVAVPQTRVTVKA